MYVMIVIILISKWLLQYSCETFSGARARMRTPWIAINSAGINYRWRSFARRPAVVGLAMPSSNQTDDTGESLLLLSKHLYEQGAHLPLRGTNNSPSKRGSFDVKPKRTVAGNYFIENVCTLLEINYYPWRARTSPNRMTTNCSQELV